MKLSQINEGKPVVKNAGKSLGSLTQFINDSGTEDETKFFSKFLKNPTDKTWIATKWVIDSATRRALQLGDEYKDAVKDWQSLRGLTAPTVVSSVYLVNPKQAKDTPLQKTNLTEPNQERLMSSLGPQGFVGTLSNIGKLPSSRRKSLLKQQADSAKKTIAAAKKDIPGIKIVKKF